MKRTTLLLTGLTILLLRNQAQTVTDYDGNVYGTVKIGNQLWFKENLKVTHFNNGDPIPNVKGSTEWGGLSTGARCYYANDSAASDSVYGPLYNWYAVNDINNLCPSEWHVSTDADWTEAETSLGGSAIAGGKMKEAGILHWTSPNSGATNSSGFTGLPGGMRGLSNTFQLIYENGLWWTATSSNAAGAWSRYLWYANAGVDRNAAPKTLGMSVRCVKDINTGIGSNYSPRNFTLYPNPAMDKITIESSGNKEQVVRFYNLSGELVMQSVLTKGPNVIDVSSLPAGSYLLKTDSESGTMQQKLIILAD